MDEPLNITYGTAVGEEETGAILRILAATGVFNEEEIGIAKELLLDRTGYYRFLTAKAGERVTGYLCYAGIDGTDRRYEVYWLAVDPAVQHRGIAKGLIRELERRLAAEHCKKIIIITSSTTAYLPARMTYERCGYVCEAVLKDYFKKGDDEVFYVKDTDSDDE